MFPSMCVIQGSATVTLTGVSTVTPGWTFAELGSPASPQLPDRSNAASIQTAVEVLPTANSVSFMFLTPPPATLAPGDPAAEESAPCEPAGGAESQQAMEFFHARGNPQWPAGTSASGPKLSQNISAAFNATLQRALG